VQDDYEGVANDIWQLASEQRLKIMLKLLERNSNVTAMAKDLDSTVAELYRNFEKLMKSDLIYKDSSGNYNLTTYGKAVCDCIPSLSFLSRNKKYFNSHEFGDLPKKFIQSIGSLESGQHQKGYVKVMQHWKEIVENANEYIYDILHEEPLELVKPIVSKAKNGVKINSIFTSTTVIPQGRKEMVNKAEIRKLIQDGMIERKMNDVKVGVILNEKEACVIFPKDDGEADMSSIFYGTDPEFHQWCFDYFKDCWNNSQPFQESKLQEK
jgi:predicted transcriptional regulator